MPGNLDVLLRARRRLGYAVLGMVEFSGPNPVGRYGYAFCLSAHRAVEPEGQFSRVGQAGLDRDVSVARDWLVSLELDLQPFP